MAAMLVQSQRRMAGIGLVPLKGLRLARFLKQKPQTI
jgi:hypothetical protein